MKECELAGNRVTLGGKVITACGHAYHARTADGENVGPIPEVLCKMAVQALAASHGQQRGSRRVAWFDEAGQPARGEGAPVDIEPYLVMREQVLQPILDKYARGATLVPAGTLRELAHAVGVPLTKLNLPPANANLTMRDGRAIAAALEAKLARLLSNSEESFAASPLSLKRRLTEISGAASPSDPGSAMSLPGSVPQEPELRSCLASARKQPEARPARTLSFREPIDSDDEPQGPPPRTAGEMITRAISDRCWLEFAKDACAALKLDVEATLHPR